MKSYYLNLCIGLKVYGLGLNEKEIIYTYLIASQEYIDQCTLKYKNKLEFFKKKKQEILNQIIMNPKKFQMDIFPTDIELSKKEIYVTKTTEYGTKIIQPLFQEIYYGKTVVLLEDLIKNRLYKENLKRLYLCDETMDNQEYESLFTSFPSILLSKIKYGLINAEVVSEAWNILKCKERIYCILRLLLFSGTTEDFQKEFIQCIPLKESFKNNFENNDQLNMVKTYRVPYKD